MYFLWSVDSHQGFITRLKEQNNLYIKVDQLKQKRSHIMEATNLATKFYIAKTTRSNIAQDIKSQRNGSKDFLHNTINQKAVGKVT